MTDRELLENAAKAMGWKEMRFDERGWLYVCVYQGDPKEWELWDPLTDDGDALRLAVKLRLRVCTPTTDSDCALASNGDVTKYSQDDVEGELIKDLYAATRRAIVRAAAAIGEKL